MAYPSSLRVTVFPLRITAFALWGTVFPLRVTVFALQVTAFPLRITAFALQVTVFALRITAFALRGTAFTLRVTIFPLRITIFPLRITIFPLRITVFPLRITVFALWVTAFALRVTVFALRITAFPLRITVFALRITAFAPRITAFALGITAFALRFSLRREARAGPVPGTCPGSIRTCRGHAGYSAGIGRDLPLSSSTGSERHARCWLRPWHPWTRTRLAGCSRRSCTRRSIVFSTPVTEVEIMTHGDAVPLSLAAIALVAATAGCKPTAGTPPSPTPLVLSSAAPGPAPGPEIARPTFSAFGSYQPLPEWSGWCGLLPDADAEKCAAPLAHAVDQQTAKSRPVVRQHGWHLWASIWSPIAAGAHNDAIKRRTNLYGTKGCWSTFDDGSPACSGSYPLWLTWPNTGKPYGSAPEARAASSPGPGGGTLRNRRSAFGPAHGSSGKTLAKGDPDPTQVQTVDFPKSVTVPQYNLPPLTLVKQCGMTLQAATDALNKKDYPPIVAACTKAGAPDLFSPAQGAVNDGTAFVNQGDVMIATESLSVEGYTDINRHGLYDKTTLGKSYADKAGTIASSLGRKYVSTKHMFWPVKGCRPGVKVGDAGCRVRYGALPPWVPKDFKSANYATNADYHGYEQWQSVVAVDTCRSAPGAACPPGGAATLELSYVDGATKIVAKTPEVYSADDFVHVQISEEVLMQHFTATDRALLDQATIWAYGDGSNGFEAGDFLVVAAMHVVTKELKSWTFQTVWWSPMTDSLADCPLEDHRHCFGQTGGYAATSGSKPNDHSGLTQAQIDAIDARVGPAWRRHYLMTDSYGIGYEMDGTRVTAASYFDGKPPAWATTGPSGQPLPLLPVSCNVYIEPVVHPLGTDCQNCHRRAGFPETSCAEYPGGCGRASYQTAQCADLLGDYGGPQSDPCLTKPWAWHTASGNDCHPDGGTQCNGKDAYPVLDTDLVWIIADNHLQPPLRPPP